jgi:hypothetical protein
MKLREFISYRKECPVCQNLLVTSFHSQKRQKNRYEDDRFLVIFPLNALKKGQINYKVGYSFGLDDNSFHVEFYNQDEVRFQNDSPTFLMARFKELDKNLQSYKIYKHCTNCNRYNYSTEDFNIDYKTCSIGEISIHTEHVVMAQPTEDGYKVYKMLNYYKTKETWLNYGKVSLKDIVPRHLETLRLSDMEVPNMLQTGIIPFTTHDETMQRVGKLIIFS